jgi:Transglycosylase SLT domain
MMLSLRGIGALPAPPASIQTALQNASTQYGVPLPLLESVAYAESSYNPAVTSSAGAQGLLQIMPANDASLGITNPFDAQQSANAGAQYLAQLYSQYGNWNTALIAYNEGPGNLANQGPFASSQSYAAGILANAGLPSSGSVAQTSTDLTTGLPALDTATSDATDLSSVLDPSGDSSSGSTDLSFTDDSGNLTGLGWGAIAAAAGLLVWAVAR